MSYLCGCICLPNSDKRLECGALGVDIVVILIRWRSASDVARRPQTGRLSERLRLVVRFRVLCDHVTGHVIWGAKGRSKSTVTRVR